MGCVAITNAIPRTIIFKCFGHLHSSPKERHLQKCVSLQNDCRATCTHFLLRTQLKTTDIGWSWTLCPWQQCNFTCLCGGIRITLKEPWAPITCFCQSSWSTSVCCWMQMGNANWAGQISAMIYLFFWHGKNTRSLSPVFHGYCTAWNWPFHETAHLSANYSC